MPHAVLVAQGRPRSANATQILLLLLFFIAGSQLMERFLIVARKVDGLGEVDLFLYCCTGLLCLISGASELKSCIMFQALSTFDNTS